MTLLVELPTPTSLSLGTNARAISSWPTEAVMIRSGLLGMLTMPFTPSTSRGQPKLVGLTIPGTFSK